MVERTTASALRRGFRFTLLSAISLSLILMVLAISLYPKLLTMPGGWINAAEAAFLLIVHAFIVLWATTGDGEWREPVLLRAARFGAISAIVEIAHIAVETFANLSPRAGTISTGAVMAALVITWAISGYSVARASSKPGLGWLAGVGSAICCMLLVSAFGLILLNTCSHRLELNNIGSPDLLRSGWTDLRAFTIADLFEAVVKVLTVGPVLGGIFGGAGGLLAGARRP